MPPLLRLSEADLAGATDEEVAERVAAAHEANIREAIGDSASFVEFAMPDEETGEPIEAAPMHREWHAHIASHRLACIVAPVEHGKTSQIGVGYTLWAIGTNPNARCAIISNTAGQAEKILSAIRGNIERNALVRAVFPHLRRSAHPEAAWGQSAITIERKLIVRDPTVQALGVGGALVGSRLDLIVLDDVLDFENTRTAEQCAKLVEWFETTVLTRLTPRGRIVVIGTPWSTVDLLAELQKRAGWGCRVYCAVENPDDSPAAWRSVWPRRWAHERLMERFNNTLPITFARKYLCRIRDNTTARFRSEWIELAKGLGRGRTVLPRRPLLLPSGRKLPCYTGVDLGMSPRKRRAYAGAEQGEGLTVIFTIAVDERARRIVVGVESGRWTAPEILTRIQSAHQRYESNVLVEDNGAQSFLVQWAGTRGIPVTPFTTGRNKHDETYGIESLAVEMRSGLWVIPSGQDGNTLDPEVAAWVSEMLHYSPEGHTGDRLMASWFAREGARSLIAQITAHLPTLDR